jgi:hypothetical protein
MACHSKFMEETVFLDHVFWGAHKVMWWLGLVPVSLWKE